MPVVSQRCWWLELPFRSSCVAGSPPRGASMPVHAPVIPQHQHEVAQVVLFTHLSSPSANTLQHGHVCFYACHVRVMPCVGLDVPVYTCQPSPSTATWCSGPPVHTTVIVILRGTSISICTPAMSQQCHLISQPCLPFPRAVACWQEHACFCISCAPALMYGDLKSPALPCGIMRLSSHWPC